MEQERKRCSTNATLGSAIFVVVSACRLNKGMAMTSLLQEIRIGVVNTEK